MRAHFITFIFTLTLCFAATNHFAWPPIILFFTFFSLFPLFFNNCLVSGGFAWHKMREAAATGGPPIAPGPAGWPLLGCIPIMGPLAHRRLAELSSSYNARRLMAFSLGATRIVISSHPDTAREILCGSAFSDRPVKESARLLMFDRAIGFAPSGEYWRRLRRIAATNMFSPKKIAMMEGLRQRVAGEMIGRVGREMERRGVVQLREVLQTGSLESVLGSVFGRCLGVEREELLKEMVREGYALIGRFNWEDYFPLWGCAFLDFYGVGERCKRLSVQVKSLVGGIIEERRRRRERDDKGEDGFLGFCDKGEDDFLGFLLALPMEERLSDSDMIAVLWEMIFRGGDVVAILLEWAMARLVLHPNIQATAQQELNMIVGHARPVNDSDVSKLPYLRAIVKEVLRLHPPGPLLSWARLATHDVYVGKSFVPAGTTAMVNMWAITHDGSIWKDPWAFRPERFLEEDVNVMGSDLRLSPFGAGRRVCPGRALGLATVHLWLARLLQQYMWLPGRPIILSECLRLSLELKKPLICRAVRRNPLL